MSQLCCARVLAAATFAFATPWSAIAEAPDVPAQDSTDIEGHESRGIAPDDPATIAALRAFELRIQRMHARQLARAEEDALVAPPAPAEEEATPAESDDAASEAPRLRLESVLDRMSISTRWQVDQGDWAAGIRLRYSRSVEFDPATESYALIEATEIAPAVSYRFIAMGRAMRVVVRRTGYAAWEKALFAGPSRWLFVDRPNRAEEAEQLAPGTSITLSNGTSLFLGADLSEDLGQFPLGVRFGPFASGEYFVRLERLAGVRSPREWLVSVGGSIPRGIAFESRLRTPGLLLDKRLRIAKANWRIQRGVRFFLRAGPLDLRGDPDAAELLRTAMAGAALFRFADARLLGANLTTADPHVKLGQDLLDKLERFPNVARLLAIASKNPEGIPYTESISRFTSRAHGEAGFELWLLLYGLDLDSDWYAEESMMVASEDPSSLIFSYPVQRRWDRGWLLFPRETQDLQMITVLDGEGEDLFTEVSFEIQDAHAHRREGRAYRAQILRFLSEEVARKLPVDDPGSPSGPREVAGGLPDLSHGPMEDERVSIYLRLILGPRFHERLLAGAKPGKERKERITEWQKRISKTIRVGGDGIEELVRAHRVEDLFVDYRIAITPHSRWKETPRPTTLYTGSFGDPRQIPSYRRLRAAFDAAGSRF